VLFLDGREGRRALRAGLRIGETLPANCTSAGKAILATIPPAERKALWGGRPLTALTADSIATWPRLEAELDTVRERGWALNVEESEDGLSAVAAALTESGGRALVRAALVVAGPTARMGAERTAAIAAGVVREASLVAGRLSPG
jgi:DNA-binding IclR family transcriptional regulator